MDNMLIMDTLKQNIPLYMHILNVKESKPLVLRAFDPHIRLG